MLEKHMSIGWGYLSSSVAFLSFKKAKIHVFCLYFCVQRQIQAIFLQYSPKKMNCKVRKAFKDTLGVGFKRLYHRYATPTLIESLHSKKAIFQKITLKADFY